MFLPDNSIFTPVADPNMDPSRTANRRLSVEERITSFDEVDATYTEEQALNESSRCLKCPTHWCQKACPAGVPVTDFIARVRAHDYEGAYQLIRSASMLPEMCSRVCPQEKQCQSNCTRGIRGQSVGIGRLERFVIEEHYRSGKPDAAAPANGKRVAVIGAGPSGLSAAERLTDKGFSVTIYEGADRAGGLLEYGIPNMKLEKQVIDRRVNIMKAEGIDFVTCADVGGSTPAQDVLDAHDAVVLACGAKQARDINAPGRDAQGIYFAVDYLTSVTRSLLDSGFCDGKAVSAKDKKVLVIGGGDTGNDCVGTAIRQGCASVTQLEMMPCPPTERTAANAWPEWPKVLKTDYGQQEAIAVFGSDPRIYQTTVKEFYKDEAGQVCGALIAKLESKVVDEATGRRAMVPTGEEFAIECDLVLIAAGFTGCQPYVAEAFGVNLTKRGTVADTKYATNVPHVFTCGDMRRGQSLVVWALREGRDAAAEVDKSLMGYTNL